MSSGYPVEPEPPGSDPDDRPPLFDRHGVRWDWVREHHYYVCSDPEYLGPTITSAGAMPVERCPVYANPPNEAQLVALEIERIREEGP